jgi:hypothetical protein
MVHTLTSPPQITSVLGVVPPVFLIDLVRTTFSLVAFCTWSMAFCNNGFGMSALGVAGKHVGFSLKGKRWSIQGEWKST